jgi:predicted nucleic acid-binding protein
MPFVADNSVVIAWFSRSQANAYTDRWYARLAKDEAVVPSVWPYEFANALAVLERRNILPAEQTGEILRHAEKLLTRIDSPPASAAVLLRLAREYRLSAYDAAYLELAQRLSIPLASRDAPLVSAARALGIPQT